MENRQVVLIMTDTTRKDMLGCYGDSRMVTPNLDTLAARGIRYERAYTAQPVCGPARSCIFTGTYPHSNQIVANSLALGDNVKTVGQRLTDNSIHSAYIGKWHLDGGDYFGLGRCPDGWDSKYWYDMRCYLEEMNEEDRKKSRKADTSFSGIGEDFTYAAKCTKKAIEFLDENINQDFFLTLSYDEPHGPSVCPEPYASMYEDFEELPNPNLQDDLENKPRYQKLWGEKNQNKSMKEMTEPNRKRSLLLGCNSFVDYQIGKLLTKLEEDFPNALILFTSDHGAAFGAHRLSGKGSCVYEEVANVPFIISHPKIKPRVCHYPISHADIVPTILEWFSMDIPKILEGKSLMPQIKGEKDKINDVVFMEFTRYEVDHDGFGGLQMMRAAITERYKLAIHLLDSDELYDNKIDPNEMNNLINDTNYEHIRDCLHDEILENMNRTRDPYRGYQWMERPWRKNIKESTWDIDGYTRQRENEEYEPRQLDYSTGLEMENATRKKV